MKKFLILFVVLMVVFLNMVLIPNADAFRISWDALGADAGWDKDTKVVAIIRLADPLTLFGRTEPVPALNPDNLDEAFYVDIEDGVVPAGVEISITAIAFNEFKQSSESIPYLYVTAELNVLKYDVLVPRNTPAEITIRFQQ